MQLLAPRPAATTTASSVLLKTARRYGGTCRLHAHASLRDLSVSLEKGYQILLECKGVENYTGLFMPQQISTEGVELLHINSQETITLPLGRFAQAWYAGKNRGWMMTIMARA